MRCLSQKPVAIQHFRAHSLLFLPFTGALSDGNDNKDNDVTCTYSRE